MPDNTSKDLTKDANIQQESQVGGAEGDKLSFTQRIRGLFQYKIQIVSKRKKSKSSSGEENEKPDEEGFPPGREEKKKKPKEKKAKKPKKEKVKKPKKEKPSKKAKGDGEGKKKKPLLLIILIGGGVLVAGAAVAVFLVVRSGNTPEARLEKAGQYTAGEKYDKAASVYNKLIEEELAVPEAYLGMGEALVASGDTDGAVVKLQAGYQATQDPRIEARLRELLPEESGDGASDVPPTVQPLVWSDSAFEAMTRMALGKGPSEDITREDLAGVTSLKILGGTHAVANSTIGAINTAGGYTVDDVLYSERGDIRSLADAANFPNLTMLVIGYNSIQDVSGVEKLAKLDTLGLYANNISDIAPIGTLTGLKYLFLYYNDISTLSPLDKLKDLRQLYAQHNQISDLSPVSGMESLAELFVGDNRISDIGPIAGLKNLRFFFANDNRIESIEPVAQMPTLTDVSFTGNPVADLSPAGHVQNVNKTFGLTSNP